MAQRRTPPRTSRPPKHPSRRDVLRNVQWPIVLGGILGLSLTGYITDIVKAPDVLIWQSEPEISQVSGSRTQHRVVLRNVGRYPAQDTVFIQFVANTQAGCPNAKIFYREVEWARDWGEENAPRVGFISNDQLKFKLPNFPARDSVRLTAVVDQPVPHECARFTAVAAPNRELQPKRGSLFWMRLRATPWAPGLALFSGVTLFLLVLVFVFPRVAMFLPQREKG